MKAARVFVLGVALAAGGAAALLVDSGDEKKLEPAPASTVVQFPTVDVLIAKSDIGMGPAVRGDDITAYDSRDSKIHAARFGISANR